jgi:hypothetical protein
MDGVTIALVAVIAITAMLAIPNTPGHFAKARWVSLELKEHGYSELNTFAFFLAHV